MSKERRTLGIILLVQTQSSGRAGLYKDGVVATIGLTSSETRPVVRLLLAGHPYI